MEALPSKQTGSMCVCLFLPPALLIKTGKTYNEQDSQIDTKKTVHKETPNCCFRDLSNDCLRLSIHIPKLRNLSKSKGRIRGLWQNPPTQISSFHFNHPKPTHFPSSLKKTGFFLALELWMIQCTSDCQLSELQPEDKNHKIPQSFYDYYFNYTSAPFPPEPSFRILFQLASFCIIKYDEPF